MIRNLGTMLPRSFSQRDALQPTYNLQLLMDEFRKLILFLKIDLPQEA